MNTSANEKTRRTEILEELKSLLEDYADQETLQACTEKSRLRDDLGMDSLDKVEAIMAIEEHFKIEIVVDSDDRIKTVGNLITYILEETAKTRQP